jgi:two-component system, chemotaxis family, chemotaxis protein CheY
MPFAKHLDVLVVDDTSVSRALICNGLDEIGVLAHRIARDGEEALKALMVKPAHLVITDFEMPKLNGLGLLKALREYAPTSKIGVILVTGRGDKALIEQGRKLGLNNYLAKPFTTAQLRACVEAITGKLV